MSAATAASSSYIVPPPCMLPKITQCSSRVWRILGLNPSPMTLGGTNTFLVGKGKSRILIDSGEGVPEYKKLIEEVVAKTQTEQISHLLLTHFHPDHIRGVGDVLSCFPDCKVGKIKSNVMPIEKLLPVMFPASSTADLINQSKKSLFEIEDGQEFETEGATIKAFFTPGHSDDHLIFYEKNERAVFCGDQILGYGSSVFASFPDFMKSLKVIQELKPARLYPAHGPNVPPTFESFSTEDNNNNNKSEKEQEETATYIQNYINHRLKRQDQILDVLSHKNKNNNNNADKSSFDLMTLVDEIYGDQIAGQPKLRLGAAGNTLHILKKLVLENRVAVDFSDAVGVDESEAKSILDTTKDYQNDVYLARLAAEQSSSNKKEGESCSCSPGAQNLLLQKVEKFKWKLV